MENYIKEIIDICRLPFNEITTDFKIIWLGNNIIYVCNYKKLLDYSQERIVLKVNKTTLEISGNDIAIKQMNKGEIVITGRLNSICLGDESVEGKGRK